MSPLDDELRAALHGRARVLTPSPDPLAGIERRAKRLQRNRIGAAMAGSVLAVVAIAAVVPALQSSTTAPRPPQVAGTEQASPAPTSYALDPSNPWTYRGIALGTDFVDTLAREVATRNGDPAEADRVIALFGQRYEPSGRLEAVFVAQRTNGTASWGVATETESGLQILLEQELTAGSVALAAALPGDEQARLLVVAAPESISLDYGPDGAGEYSAMGELARGVAVVALSGDTSSDTYRVTLPDRVLTFPAPDPAPGAVSRPENLLSWPSRGAVLSPDLEARVLDQFRAALPGLRSEPQDSEVRYRPLFTADTDGGVRYTFGQAWTVGGSAFTVGVAEGGTEGAQFFLGPKTDAGVPVLAYLLCCQPGSTVDTLVVVPQPGTGQVLYAAGPQAELAPVGEGQDFLDGVVLVDRDRRADGDRLQLLDGDGDLDAPTFDGTVLDLLCGLTSCS